MRKLIIAGALAGFLAGVSLGLVRAHSWPVIVGRASAALFCSGMLMRWWARVWLKGLRESYAHRASEAASLNSKVKV